jgi:SAM-dependent methyltransferase/GNAT superfamily N-acetyltransferase
MINAGPDFGIPLAKRESHEDFMKNFADRPSNMSVSPYGIPSAPPSGVRLRHMHVAPSVQSRAFVAPLSLHRMAATHSLRVELLSEQTRDEVKDFVVRMRRLWGLEGPLLAEGDGDLVAAPFQGTGQLFLLRNERGVVVATLGYSRIDDSVCELSKFYVDPSYQGRGLARALHDAMVSGALARGYESVILDTLDIFAVAIQAYRSWGYALYARQDIPLEKLRAGSRSLRSMYFVRTLVGGASLKRAVTHAEGSALEFTDAGRFDYPRAYNRAICSYSGWRQMRDLHLSSIKADAEVVWDVGGGSGRMMEEILKTGRSALTLDLSPRMLSIAANDNQVDHSRLHLSDALDPRIGSTRLGCGVRPPERSVDHILSHSVLWMLPEPGAFFDACARILRSGGRLSLSTVLPGSCAGSAPNQTFLEGLAADMNTALGHERPFGLSRRQAGRIARMMVEANESFASEMNHTWSSRRLVALARRSGLKWVAGSHAVGYGGTMGFWIFENP